MLDAGLLQGLKLLFRDLDPFQRPPVTFKDMPNLAGKVYLVTGASSGIGFEVARVLVAKNARVYIMGSTQQHLDAALKQLKQEFPRADVHTLHVDYNDLSTIPPQTYRIIDENMRLDGVVHNAGVCFVPPGSKTVQNHERTLGINAMGPHLVQRLLDDRLIATAAQSPKNSVRVVWVSSSSVFTSPPGGVKLDNIYAPLGKYGVETYPQSKAIGYHQGVVWPKMHPGSGVVSVSVHPGVAHTRIMRSLPPLRRKVLNMIPLGVPPEVCAYSELLPLLSPDITEKDNGSYYIPFCHKKKVRKDVEEAAHGQTGLDLWSWLDEHTAPFVKPLSSSE